MKKDSTDLPEQDEFSAKRTFKSSAKREMISLSEKPNNLFLNNNNTDMNVLLFIHQISFILNPTNQFV